MQTIPPEVIGDIEEAFAGKLWAYVAVVKEHCSGLGVAVANEKGYSPVPHAAGLFYEMSMYADELNEARGMDSKQRLDIIITTL